MEVFSAKNGFGVLQVAGLFASSENIHVYGAHKG